MIDPHPVQNPALGVVGQMQDGMRSPPVTISKKAKKAKAKREQVRLDREEQERKREIDNERIFEAGQRECVEKDKEHARLQADRVKQEEEYRLQMEAQRLESERQLNEKQVELTVELQKLAERHASKVAAAEQKLNALTASHCLDLEELRTHMQADMDSRENAWHIDKERLRHALQESADMVSILEERVEQLTADVARGEDKFSKAQQSLQSSNEQLSDLTRQNEDLVAKVTALTQTAEDYKARNKQLQMTSAGESDMRRELSKLQEDVREKDASLAAFRVEGQALAKKQVLMHSPHVSVLMTLSLQSDMEKNVRNSRKEVREKEAEIAKLKEVRDQYVKTIEEMQDVIRQNEAAAVSSQKQMSVMQAVSQASQDKITKLEADIQSMAEEIASQRRAMESAWNENSELKRKVTDLKAEKEDLRGQLGMGASKANETESFRRDLEQREAILRATNKQLQELNETRRRWQEAITSREALASE
ncbi:LAMB1, partial [Symbiodinium microadriaticum]